MTQPVILILYCVLILLASLSGGWIPLLIRLTHQRMQLAISLVAGFMLGVAMLHLLPHALLATAAPAQTVGWLVAGLLVMFFIERFFCFHHHDAPPEHGPDRATGDPHREQPAEDGPSHDHTLTWSGAAIGLTLHSLIAGIALGASMSAETHFGVSGIWPGLAVFLVIIAHKPFDALTLGTLMAAGGQSRGTRHLINGLFALAVPLGALLFQFGIASAESSTTAGAAVAFTCGVFLCISMSDLLPELQFHQHDRLKLSAALLLGLALAWSISHFEARGHGHREHPLWRTAATQQHDHEARDNGVSQGHD